MDAVTPALWTPAWDWHAARAALAAADPALAPALEVPLPPRPVRSLFGQLVRAICMQQLSIHAAYAVEAKLRAAAGGEPTPERLLALGEEELRAAGLSRRKAGYVRTLAESAASGLLDPAALASLQDEAVVARLTALPGIGRWTVEMTLIFALQRPDVWPVDDLGIRAAVAMLDGTPMPSPRATAARGEVWRPHRSTAALALWAWRRAQMPSRATRAE